MTGSAVAASKMRLLLLIEAVTFAIAASIHFGLLTTTGYEHRAAGIAESVIAAVLLVGIATSWLARTWQRYAGLAVQAFALLGTLVGIFTIVVGVGPRTLPDIAYHVAIVVLLAWGLTLAARIPAGEASRSS